MSTTETRAAPARRKPKAIEFTILFGWHALLSGAFIVAYLSGDEDTYAMHQVAGYLVLAAIALRLIAAIVAPMGSPLRLRPPGLASFRDWISRGLTGRWTPLPRRPLLALMAAVLLIVIGAAAGSGAFADFVPLVEDVHQALGELALWIVLAHVAIVIAVHGLAKCRRTTARAAMLAAALVALTAAAGAADPARDAILDAYARQARSETPGFDGFSAVRGEQLYRGPHEGGDPLTPACAACHTSNPRVPGRHVKTGRAIEPMAVSVNPRRFTDAADVEKRFARDCPNVLGRPCTAREKGDFITFLSDR